MKVTSSCEDESHVIFKWMDSPSFEKASTLVARLRPAVRFRSTIVSTPAAPNPPCRMVRASASQCPSGDREIADQIVGSSPQLPRPHRNIPITTTKARHFRLKPEPFINRVVGEFSNCDMLTLATVRCSQRLYFQRSLRECRCMWDPDFGSHMPHLRSAVCTHID